MAKAPLKPKTPRKKTTKAKEGELSAKEKKELSAEEKEYKSKRKLVQEKLSTFMVRVVTIR